MTELLPDARLAYLVTGERHRRSASFVPLTNHHERILNANGEEIARCESNHSAMLGRSAGLRIVLISQRAAKLHKDSLTQVETLVAMRVIAPQDQKAVKAWLDGAPDQGRAAEIMASLSSLPGGEGWVYAPERGVLVRARFPAIATFDSGRPLDRGEAPALRPIDVAALRAALLAAEPIAESKSRSCNGKDGQVDEKPASAAEIAAADARGYERGFIDGAFEGARQGWSAAMGEAREGLSSALTKLEGRRSISDEDLSRVSRVAAVGRALKGQPPRPCPSREPPTLCAPARLAGHAPDTPDRSEMDAALPPAKQKILDALAWLAAIGQAAPPRNVVAFVGSISSKSSSYANNVSALRTVGLIDYPGDGALALTPAGRASARAPDEALTHETMMTLLAGKLGPATTRILAAAAKHHPNALSRADLAAAAGASPQSSAFANNVSRLSSLGLVTYPASGLVRAADLLFPERYA